MTTRTGEQDIARLVATVLGLLPDLEVADVELFDPCFSLPAIEDGGNNPGFDVLRIGHGSGKVGDGVRAGVPVLFQSPCWAML
jgi:hypothetical protein